MTYDRRKTADSHTSDDLAEVARIVGNAGYNSQLGRLHELFGDLAGSSNPDVRRLGKDGEKTMLHLTRLSMDADQLAADLLKY